MYLSGVIYVRYMYVSIGNTTDIKLADRFSRAVNFFFFDKVTRLAGWQVVFFKIEIKIKYARRCAYYLMHTNLR